MPSTIDATVGGATANSYVTDAEFVAYLQNRPYAPPANVLDDRTRALLAAARDLEVTVTWNAQRVGERATTSQALRFPAHHVRNRFDDGYYPDGIIPDFVKRGQMEQAIAYIPGGSSGGTDPQATGGDLIKMVKVDVITVEFEAGSGTTSTGTIWTDSAAREIAWWTEGFDDITQDYHSVPLVLV